LSISCSVLRSLVHEFHPSANRIILQPMVLDMGFLDNRINIFQIAA